MPRYTEKNTPSAPKADAIAAGLAHYGFTEISTLCRFLRHACDDTPGPCEWLYIRSKLRECLERHDDGGSWFDPLRDLEKFAGKALQACEPFYFSDLFPRQG